MSDIQHAMNRLVAFYHKMIHDPVMPEMPPEFAEVEGLADALERVSKLRNILDAFSRGDLSPDISLRGVIAGRLKALQANLLHLTWQIRQVADGDFSQRVDFMGEFSVSFNSMVEQLDAALTALSKSEARFRYMAEHDSRQKQKIGMLTPRILVAI